MSEYTTFYLRNRQHSENICKLFSVEFKAEELEDFANSSSLSKEDITKMIRCLEDRITKSQILIRQHRQTIAERETRIVKISKTNIYQTISSEIDQLKIYIELIEAGLFDNFQILSRLKLLMEILENNQGCEILMSLGK